MHRHQLLKILVPACLILLAPLSASADEMDELLILEEGQPLREAWEECAASFAKARLRTEQAPDKIAADAFRSCIAHERRLRQFLVQRVGEQKGEGVIELLRARLQPDLAAAINELRR